MTQKNTSTDVYGQTEEVQKLCMVSARGDEYLCGMCDGPARAGFDCNGIPFTFVCEGSCFNGDHRGELEKAGLTCQIHCPDLGGQN